MSDHFLTRLSPVELLMFQWCSRLVRYFVVSGLAYLVFWVWRYSQWKPRFLYPEMPAKSHIRREITHSVISTFFLLFPSVVLVLLKPHGWIRVYIEIREYPMAWYVTSFAVVLFLHDAYFYWTHRLMHLKWIYPYCHRLHHLSVSPTPFAAFAFHPFEALLQSFFFVILLVAVPLHYSVFFTFSIFSMIVNVYGHLGFNVLSEQALGRFPWNLLSHSAQHGWHHRHYHGNYGFYFTFWDRWLGTYRGGLKPRSDSF